MLTVPASAANRLLRRMKWPALFLMCLLRSQSTLTVSVYHYLVLVGLEPCFICRPVCPPPCLLAPCWRSLLRAEHSVWPLREQSIRAHLPTRLLATLMRLSQLCHSVVYRPSGHLNHSNWVISSACFRICKVLLVYFKPFIQIITSLNYEFWPLIQCFCANRAVVEARWV